MTRLTIQILLFLFFCSQGHAGLEAQGEIGLYYNKLSVTDNKKNANQSYGLEFKPKISQKFSRDFRFLFQAGTNSDFATKDSFEKFQFNEKNIFLEYSPESFSLKLGVQNLTPDGPDIVNPMDVIHAKNYKNPLNPESLGSLGVSLSQDLSEFTWQVFVIPKQTYNRLPGEESIWWPREQRLPIESEYISDATIPANVDYKITDGVEIDSASKMNFAVKLQAIKASFEGSLLYYEGLAQEPKLFFSATSTNFILDSPVTLIPFYYKHRVWAANWAIPLGGVNFKGGANWMKPVGSDARLSGEESTLVLAIEKNQEYKHGMITWLIEYVKQTRQAKDQISFLRSIFERAWIAGIRLPMGEKHELLGGYTYDTIGKSSVGKLTYKYRINDSLSSELSAQILQGPDSSMVGLYKNYDQYGVRLNYNF